MTSCGLLAARQIAFLAQVLGGGAAGDVRGQGEDVAPPPRLTALAYPVLGGAEAVPASCPLRECLETTVVPAGRAGSWRGGKLDRVFPIECLPCRIQRGIRSRSTHAGGRAVWAFGRAGRRQLDAVPVEHLRDAVRHVLHLDDAHEEGLCGVLL